MIEGTKPDFYFILFLLESPCWLIKHGIFKKGTHNLCKPQSA